MFALHFCRLPAPMLLLAALPVLAQNDSPPPTPPLALQYRSVFAGYHAFDDLSVARWTVTNDTVGKIGGWRTYAKEAAQPESTAGTAAPAATDLRPASDSSVKEPGAHPGHGAKP